MRSASLPPKAFASFLASIKVWVSLSVFIFDKGLNSIFFSFYFFCLWTLISGNWSFLRRISDSSCLSSTFFFTDLNFKFALVLSRLPFYCCFDYLNMSVSWFYICVWSILDLPMKKLVNFWCDSYLLIFLMLCVNGIMSSFSLNSEPSLLLKSPSLTYWLWLKLELIFLSVDPRFL